MKNRLYAVYHSLIVQDHEMTFKAYQRANWANFLFGAAIIQAINTGFNVSTAALGFLTAAMFYKVHKAKKEVEN